MAPDSKKEKAKVSTYKPKKKFKAKILKIFVFITLVPLFVVSATSLYFVVKTRQQNIAELQNLALDNASEKVTKFLVDRTSGLNLVLSASAKNLKGLPAEDLLFLLVNSYKSSRARSMDFIDQDGQIIMQVKENGAIVYNRDYLEKATGTVSLFKDIKEALIIPKQAITISRVEGNVSDSLDFQSAIAGKMHYGPVEFVDGQPVMRLSAQIRNQNEEIIGIVSAEVSLTEVDSIISNITLGNFGYTYASDVNGRSIASGTKEFAAVGEHIGETSLVREVLNGKSRGGRGDFVTYLSGMNEKVVFAGRAVPAVGWFIFSEWPVDDAFSVIGNILYLSLYIALAVLIVVIILAFYFTGQIIKPIKALDKGAREIAKGNFDWKIRLYTHDEFELLAHKFNDMIKVLKDNQRLRDEFVFISAHELRTPVTAIRGYLSMILEGSFGPVPKEIKENLDIVNSSNDRLVQLVHDLLEIARSEAGKMKIAIADIDIVGNVKEVLNELDSLAKEKNIKINYKTPSTKPMVKADGYKLKEVLVNIIGNAIKYTIDDGGIEIWHEEKEGMLNTHIKDHGIGMSEEEVGQLFSKFYRAQNEETKDIEGTGLGLFIVKEIIERMGGQVWVTSKKGEGSTFSFSLKKV